MELPTFDFKTEALLLKPDGTITTIKPEKDQFLLKELYAHLKCDMIEVVRLSGKLQLPAMVLIVDEDGKPKGKAFNDTATKVFNSATDHIRGTAIYCWRKLIK